jgi:hypothetical protein
LHSPSLTLTPFLYYKNLTPAQRRVYDRSDAVGAVPLPGPEQFRPLIAALSEALDSGSRPWTEQAARGLMDISPAVGVY